MNDKGADGGNGWYDNHLGQWGYFIYAAAVLANNEPGWWRKWDDRILHIISDVAEPSRASEKYPFMREKDWYDGISWSTGLDELDDGKMQKSVSEAVNGWYSIYLYGLATGNDRVRDIGRLALGTELRSGITYTQMPASGGIYPAPFSDNKIVGTLWSTKVFIRHLKTVSKTKLFYNYN